MREEPHRAWPVVSELLNENPDSAKAIYLAGWVLRDQGHVGMALQMFRRALALEQKVANIWQHYGACLHDLHKYDEAIEAFGFVHKALPTDPMPMATIAASHIQAGRPAEAVKWADKALEIDPEHRVGSIAKAFGCLALGRWQDGWDRAAYLYGDTLTIRVYNPPEKEEPMWDGSPGKTVVVQADQGLGDMIMFAQCLPEMQRDCKKVIVETNERLASVFRRNFPGIDVYSTLKERADVDWPSKYEIDAHIHISWLGKYYRKSSADFPRKAYLTADPELVEMWEVFLEKYPRPWTGIAWRGGIQRTNEASRSMKLEDLAPVLNQGGTYFSLAYQEVGKEIALWNIDHDVQVIAPDLYNEGDYERTLALIAALDQVVTVTTTVAHACGALGKKAYVIVPNNPQWRYSYRCEDGGMIWYPENSVQLYRVAPGEQDWSHVIGRVVRDRNISVALTT